MFQAMCCTGEICKVTDLAQCCEPSSDSEEAASLGPLVATPPPTAEPLEVDM